MKIWGLSCCLSLQDGYFFSCSHFLFHIFFGHHFGQQIVSFVMKVPGIAIATSRLDGLASSLCLFVRIERRYDIAVVLHSARCHWVTVTVKAKRSSVMTSLYLVPVFSLSCSSNNSSNTISLLKPSLASHPCFRGWSRL